MNRICATLLIVGLISPMMLPAALAQEGDDLATPTPIPPLPVQEDETATPTQQEGDDLATPTPIPPLPVQEDETATPAQVEASEATVAFSDVFELSSGRLGIVNYAISAGEVGIILLGIMQAALLAFLVFLGLIRRR